MKKVARNNPQSIYIELPAAPAPITALNEAELAALRRELEEHAAQVEQYTRQSQLNRIADAVAAELHIQKMRRTKNFPTFRLRKT
jgi:hypothetical protein